MLIIVHLKEDGEMRAVNTDLISELRRLDRKEPVEGTKVFFVGGGPETCNVLDVMETVEQIVAMEQTQQLSRREASRGNL